MKMVIDMTTFTSWSDSLCHHGVKGQKWGVRRYQNPDGTLTAEGKSRYGISDFASNRDARHTGRVLNRLDRKWAKQRVAFQNQNEKLNKAFNKVLKKGIDAGAENNSKKDDRVVQKMKQRARKTALAAKKADMTASLTLSVLKDATDKGYTVKSKKVTRYVSDGRSIASTILQNAAGTAFGLATGFYVGGSSARVVDGTKYKVRNAYQ